LYVAPSGVKSPGDLCILLPDDMDDFTIRPAVDAVQILETVQSFRPPPIPQISPGDNVESGILLHSRWSGRNRWDRDSADGFEEILGSFLFLPSEMALSIGILSKSGSLEERQPGWMRNCERPSIPKVP
jgi:hypothetical protein